MSRHVEWIGQLPESEEPICVPRRQMKGHVFWETAALVVQVPFLAYLAANPALHPVARVMAGGAGIATFIVDGRLMHKNRKRLKS